MMPNKKHNLNRLLVMAGKVNAYLVSLKWKRSEQSFIIAGVPVIAGFIFTKTGLPAKPIWITERSMEHLVKRHGTQLKNDNQINPLLFAISICQRYESIYEGEGNSVLLCVKIKSNRFGYAYVELSENVNGDYEVNTAFFGRANYVKNKKIIWAKGRRSASN